MAKMQTFEQVGRRCVLVLGVVAALVAAVAVIVVLHTAAVPAVAWAAAIPVGAVVGWSLMLFVVVAASLATWSARSHGLAVEHGMIPRWSTGWAAFAWFIPLLNFVLPFSMLQQRFRSYHVIAKKAMRWLQALFVGTCLLWGWLLVGIVPDAKERWLPLAVAATALLLWRLRGLIAALTRVQLAAEGTVPGTNHNSAPSPPPSPPSPPPQVVG